MIGFGTGSKVISMSDPLKFFCFWCLMISTHIKSYQTRGGYSKSNGTDGSSSVLGFKHLLQKERRKDGSLTAWPSARFQNISKTFGHLVAAFSAVFHLLKQVRVLLKSTGRNIDSPGRQKHDKRPRWEWVKVQWFNAQSLSPPLPAPQC